MCSRCLSLSLRCTKLPSTSPSGRVESPLITSRSRTQRHNAPNFGSWPRILISARRILASSYRWSARAFVMRAVSPRVAPARGIYQLELELNQNERLHTSDVDAVGAVLAEIVDSDSKISTLLRLDQVGVLGKCIECVDCDVELVV
jgi:hypothetical protein